MRSCAGESGRGAMQPVWPRLPARPAWCQGSGHWERCLTCRARNVYHCSELARSEQALKLPFLPTRCFHNALEFLESTPEDTCGF